MTENIKENDTISRRSAREQGFILLFEMSFSQEELSIDEIKENASECRDIKFSAYAQKIASGVQAHQEEIDALISAHLKKGWKLSRISRVSLCVLRLAVYEIKYEKEVPVSVSINEAVELVKKYSPDESGFVNGVLGAVARAGEAE